MKHVLKIAFLSAISLILLSVNAPTALASMPYLTATSSGNGYVQININSADSYGRIDLSYRPQGTSLWTQITNVGFTDQSGYFSQSVNIGYQGSQMDVYVTVNGQQSPTVSVNGSGGCTYNCGGSLSLSPSSLNLSTGQSQIVTTYGSNNNYVYISNNSNSSVASATVNGNSINVYGNSAGSTSITVCSSNYSGSCATLYVTVNGNGCGYYNCNNNQITFSQSNVILSSGQSSSVTIYGGSYGSYYVSNNSNSGAVTATASGSVLNLYGYGSGSSTITVCSSGYSNQCGTLYVTVNGGNCGYYNCGGQITFSQSSVNLSYGQSSSVSIYGGNYGSYYVSNNSNSSVVSATVSGSIINLYGYNSGSSTLTVCSSGNSSQCGYLYITVNGNNNCGYYNCNGQIYFTPTNPSVNVGQTTNVAINSYQNSSYNTYYISSNSNPNVVSATISGNLVSLYGRTFGTATITVCSSYGGSQCASMYVTVNGGGGTGNNDVSISGNYFSPNNITVSAGSVITFHNYDSMSHTVTSNTGAFNSGTLTPGAVFSLTLNTPGTYYYHCNFHSGMTGTITVTGTGGGVLGASLYANGTLVKDNGTIYQIYRNTKSGFANYPAFTGFGFKLSNVISADISSLLNSGHVISSASGQHPWGTWVKNGGTIYFVHENGLIPIASYDTFLSNGGNMSLVVNANAADMSLVRLSILEPYDSRLQ